MRQVLIDADALAVDHRSREAEARLHQAGRSFFTQRFRTTVDKLIGAFQSAGEEYPESPPPISARVTWICAAAPRMRSMPPPREPRVAAVADAARDC